MLAPEQPISSFLLKPDPAIAIAEAGQHPAEQNIQVVQQGFRKLFDEVNRITPDEYFLTDTPISLQLKTGETLDATLQYRADRWTSQGGLPVTLNLAILRDRQTLSYRQWFADTRQKGPKGTPWLTFNSTSDTTYGWEGNGLAISLIARSHDVIGHAMTHFTRWSPDLPVIAYITESSGGKKLRRFGWGSHQALALGYTPDELDDLKFKKIYRHSPLTELREKEQAEIGL